MENFELTDCVYEHIKDTFYHGLFGDFKLVIDKATGYFNATTLCAAGGKNFFEWKRLEKSKRMVEYYQKSCPGNSHGGFLYEITGDNKDSKIRLTTGIYAPKELILDIASWISIEFYDKCNKVIINYFVNEFKKMDVKTFQNKIKEVEEQMVKVILEKDEEIKGKTEMLHDVFKELYSQDILIFLNTDNYVTNNGDSDPDIFVDREKFLEMFTDPIKKGWIFCHTKNLNNVLAILQEDTCCLIEFGFNSDTEKKALEVGRALVNALVKFNFMAHWDERALKDHIISTIITVEDLPPSIQDLIDDYEVESILE